MRIDFPAFTKALSPITGAATKDYLQRVKGYATLNEFIDEGGLSVSKVFGRKMFKGGHIFTRGIGASATFILLLWFTHASFKLGGNPERYLRRVSKEFPESKWRSGTGTLASLRGGGGGRNIVNRILTTIVPALDPSEFPDSRAWQYLDREDPGLLRRLEDLLKPSSWRPFESEFVEGESGSGVYAIIGLNEQFDEVKVRVGQATDLKNRLNTHLGTVQADFPQKVLPLFYNTVNIYKDGLNRAEQSIFHLIPKKLRIPNAAHPGNCKLCGLT